MTIKKFILFFIIIIAVSCGDDDSVDEPAVSNDGYLKVGSEEFTLRSGALVEYGSYEGSVFDFVLNLFSSDFTLNDEEPVFEDNVITGISIDLYVNSPFDLVETDYQKVDFDQVSGNTFQAMDLAIDYDMENESGTTRQIVDGTFTVMSSGPNYELEFNGTDNEGNEVEFYYSGQLTEVDNTQ